MNRSATRPGSLAALCACSWLFAAVGAQILTVEVLEGQRLEPLSGAFVMVGRAPGDPAAGNAQWTDAQGIARFEGPWLAEPQTVTAAYPGYGRTTVFQAPLGNVSLALFPAVVDSTLGGTLVTVEGDVLNVATVNSDGNFDVSIVLPSLLMSDYAFQDMLPYVAPFEPVEFFNLGTVDLPSNSYMALQYEFLIIPFSKGPYRIGLPGGRPATLMSVSARIPMLALLEGTLEALSENAEVLEIGVERDIDLSGSLDVDIDSDLPVAPQMEIDFAQVPSATKLTACSAALIPVDGFQQVIGFDAREAISDSITHFELATRAPGGDLSDAMNMAVGGYGDSSAAVTYSAGIVERLSGAPPYSVVLSSWMRLPELEQQGRDLLWDDVTQPGVSPSPTWTRSALGLRAIDPRDSTVQATTHWRIYAPAAAMGFELPLLPPEAPGPFGGLPDPASTPDADQLYWFFVAANPSGDLSRIQKDFIDDATHWSQRTIFLDFGSLEAPDDGGQVPSTKALRASPNPSAGAVRLAWRTDHREGGALEVWDAAGRLVSRWPVPLGQQTARWSGRDSAGRPVPGGVYWVKLCAGTACLGRERLVILRPAP